MSGRKRGGASCRTGTPAITHFTVALCQLQNRVVDATWTTTCVLKTVSNMKDGGQRDHSQGVPLDHPDRGRRWRRALPAKQERYGSLGSAELHICGVKGRHNEAPATVLATRPVINPSIVDVVEKPQPSRPSVQLSPGFHRFHFFRAFP